MSKQRFIRRIPPCSKFDIAGMESWLEDMAAKGFILKKFGFFDVAIFETGEPQNIRYRLEAAGSNGGIWHDNLEPDAQALSLNAQMGWEYLDRRGLFHIYICTDPDAPELHTDPRVHAMSMNELNKYLRRQVIRTVGLALFWIFSYYGDLLVSMITHRGLEQTLIFAAFWLTGLANEVRHLVLVSRLQSKLRSGKPLPHRKDYTKHRTSHYVLNLLYLFAAFAILFTCFRNMGTLIFRDNRIELENYADNFPFATLADLFPEAEVEYYDAYDFNEFYTWSDALTPENIVYDEFSTVTFPNGSSFPGSLYVYYHECRSDWIATALAKTYTTAAVGNEFERLFDGVPDITSLRIPGADYAAAYTNAFHYLILCKDHVVLRVRYTSNLAEYYTATELAQTILDSIG